MIEIRPTRYLWILLTTLAIIATFGVTRAYLASAVPEPIGLKVTDRDGKHVLRISWNAKLASAAEQGAIQIFDGRFSGIIRLSKQQLNQASFLYPRTSDDVEICLAIFKTDGTASKDIVRYLAQAQLEE